MTASEKRRRLSHQPPRRCEYAISGVCAGVASDRHHRRMRSQGGTDAALNIAHVCHACHMHVHANPAEAYANGWLVHSWGDL